MGALARANSYSASGEPPEDALFGPEPAGPPVEPAVPPRPQPHGAPGWAWWSEKAWRWSLRVEAVFTSNPHILLLSCPSPHRRLTLCQRLQPTPALAPPAFCALPARPLAAGSPANGASSAGRGAQRQRLATRQLSGCG